DRPHPVQDDSRRPNALVPLPNLYSGRRPEFPADLGLVDPDAQAQVAVESNHPLEQSPARINEGRTPEPSRIPTGLVKPRVRQSMGHRILDRVEAPGKWVRPDLDRFHNAKTRLLHRTVQLSSGGRAESQ